MKKTLAIILARTGSERLKNKVLLKLLNNKLTLIEYFIKRLKRCKKIDKIILATSQKKRDKVLIKLAKKNNIHTVIGSEKDVLSRIIKSLNIYGANYDIILRANADCPLFMPTIQDNHISNFIKSGKDLFSPFKNNLEPFGFSFCLFKKDTIYNINRIAKKKTYREHIENYCFDHKKKFSFLKLKKTKYKFPNLKLTLDDYDDLIKIKFLLVKLKKFKISKQPSELMRILKKT